MSIILGIDIGGTGIKGAPVNTETGELLTPRIRLVTPQPASVGEIADRVREVALAFDWKGEIGCGFPAVVKRGVIMTAANVDDGWIGTDAKTVFETATGCRTHLINDADAAGLAELHFGAAKDVRGTVLMITVGTGIGSSLIVNGVLVPNTELGHLDIRGKDAEQRASNRVRIEKELSWKKWARRFNEVLQHYERLLWPDLIILGGGMSKSFVKYAPFLEVQAPIMPAGMLNEAGIVGAALTMAHPEV